MGIYMHTFHFATASLFMWMNQRTGTGLHRYSSELAAWNVLKQSNGAMMFNALCLQIIAAIKCAPCSVSQNPPSNPALRSPGHPGQPSLHPADVQAVCQHRKSAASPSWQWASHCCCYSDSYVAGAWAIQIEAYPEATPVIVVVEGAASLVGDRRTGRLPPGLHGACGQRSAKDLNLRVQSHMMPIR